MAFVGWVSCAFLVLAGLLKTPAIGCGAGASKASVAPILHMLTLQLAAINSSAKNLKSGGAVSTDVCPKYLELDYDSSPCSLTCCVSSMHAASISHHIFQARAQRRLLVHLQNVVWSQTKLKPYLVAWLEYIMMTGRDDGALRHTPHH